MNELETKAFVGDRLDLDAAMYGPMVDSIAQEYPRIGQHSFRVITGKLGQKGHLEFYPPWESENPSKSKLPTIEIRDQELEGEWLESAIAGDALHYLGAVDPRTEKPIDPKFRKMREEFFGTLTPEQLAVDRRVYAQEGDPRNFTDWMEGSRLDAYVRGYLFPDKNDEWRQQEVYTPEQTTILEKMRGYLKGAEADAP